VDFEHAGTKMELEYANVSFLLSDAFNVRMGSLLLPIGFLNDLHEPPRFASVERPYLYNDLIPTSWSEAGLGFFGNIFPDLKYQFYMVSGLDAANFRADSGIRKGRTGLAEAKGENWAIAGRLEYQPISFLTLGLSGYDGGAAQGNLALGKAAVTLWETDIRTAIAGIHFTAAGVIIKLLDAGKISAVTNKTIGETMTGWNLEAGYDIGALFLPTPQSLQAFIRQESINTQETVSAGLSANPANHREITMLGLAYTPVPGVVCKTDWENGYTRAGTRWQQWNAGLGYEW